jgi:hypothetical protein
MNIPLALPGGGWEEKREGESGPASNVDPTEIKGFPALSTSILELG